LAARQDQLIDARAGIEHGSGVWFAEPASEMSIFSEQYDFAISLLLLEERDRYVPIAAAEEDTFDRFTGTA
jgi:hypothetical protein